MVCRLRAARGAAPRGEAVLPYQRLLRSERRSTHARPLPAHAPRPRSWGENGGRQLGLGDSTDRGKNPGEMGDNLPFAVTASTGAAEVAAGADHTCVRLRAGGIKCWGNGAGGALGSSATDVIADPTLSPVFHLGAGLNATSMSCRQQYCCALLSSSQVKW